MKNLLSAIRFITILPAGTSDEFNPSGTVPFFPVVGLLLGLMLCLVNMVAVRFWPLQVAAVIDVVFLVAVTGAFHIDGLGDTADGLLGHRTKESALLIMKDSRIGVMGVAAIVCCLALKWGGIYSILEMNNGIRGYILLFIIPAYSRMSQVIGIRFLEYGRPEGGTGHAFFEHKLSNRVFAWFVLPFFVSLFSGWTGVWLNIVYAVLTVLILKYYKKRIGCITGDMLGAITEITEAMLFLLVPVIGGQ